MSEIEEKEAKTPLKLSPGRLELKRTVEAGQVRQSFSHGRSKVVTVEVRKKRTFGPGGAPLPEAKEGPVAAPAPGQPAPAPTPVEVFQHAPHDLTSGERASRARALEQAHKDAEE